MKTSEREMMMIIKRWTNKEAEEQISGLDFVSSSPYNRLESGGISRYRSQSLDVTDDRHGGTYNYLTMA